MVDAPLAVPPPRVGVEAPAQNMNLALIQARFNPEGMLCSSKRHSTFSTHQRENTALIFFLYENKSSLLHEEFYHEMQDEDTEIDYTPVEDPRTRYRGKLSLEERKVKYRKGYLRNHISEALGPGGTQPRTKTVDFDAFTADPVHFVNYIQTKVKSNGQLNKPGVYARYKSNLTYLFR